ncbi:YIP1 family protein, partial [Staphylococcus capitis]
KLDSLNIFAKGNKFLMALNLTNLLKAFLTGVVYYSTSRLSKKTSIILGIVALILMVGFGLISGASGQSMPNMNAK